MRVLVTGAKGQLGQDLMAELASRGITGIGVDVEDMDITINQSVADELGITIPESMQQYVK